MVDEKTKEEYKALIEKGLKADEEAAMRYLAFQNKLREQQLKQDTAKMEKAESGTKKQKVPLPSDEVNYVAESRMPGNVRAGTASKVLDQHFRTQQERIQDQF